MNSQWQEFLVTQGAAQTDGRIAHFGDPARERREAAHGNVLVELSQLGLIRAHGADTASFLQGQLSNDIRLLDAARSQLAAYSTAKGRMLAVFRLFRRDEDYFLQLPLALREDIIKRLRMFVLRSKVTLDAADDLVAIGLSGPDAAQLLERAGLPAPADPNGCATSNGTTVLRLPGPFARFEIVAPIVTAQQLWGSLSPQAVRCASPAWSWLDIMAGIPSVLPGTSEEFVPQMANLDLLDGINFKKGCYPGQEIVARMQYLGRLKQRMYRARLDAPETPRPGEALYAPDFGEQAAGAVVDAQPSPNGGQDLLLIAQIGCARDSNLHLGNLQGPTLTLLALPYALPAV